MSLQMLAVDRDNDVSLKEQAAWAKRGVSIVRVDTMKQAIEQLHHNHFLLIAINADNIDFKQLLPEMRCFTKGFIFVITSDFDAYDHEHLNALGIDFYGQFQPDPERNVASALALMEGFCTYKNRIDNERDVLIYHDLFILSTVTVKYHDIWRLFLPTTNELKQPK